MATCGFCSGEFPSRQLFKHQWNEHPEEMRARSSKTLLPGGPLAAASARVARGKNGGNGEHPPGEEIPEEKPASKPAEDRPARATRQATSLDEAVAVTIVPKTFTISSSMLQVAKAATEREWGWPVMEVGDWMDTFIYNALKQRGIVIGSYTVVGEKGEPDGGERSAYAGATGSGDG